MRRCNALKKPPMQSISFPPITAPNARVLVLGSMPGQASLQAQQYYAHPRNAFWPIVCDLLVGAEQAVTPESSYAARVDFLSARGIALWDVMQSCYRPGSLDSAIEEASIVANDFAAFLRAQEAIQAIFFNGAKAEQSFRRYVYPQLADLYPGLHYARLPSTSPAHAAKRYAEKLAAWRRILDFL